MVQRGIWLFLLAVFLPCRLVVASGRLQFVWTCVAAVLFAVSCLLFCLFFVSAPFFSALFSPLPSFCALPHPVFSFHLPWHRGLVFGLPSPSGHPSQSYLRDMEKNTWPCKRFGPLPRVSARVFSVVKHKQFGASEAGREGCPEACFCRRSDTLRELSRGAFSPGR